MINKLFLSFFLFLAAALNAQEAAEPPMADALREDGKIYVVISVIAIIFISIVAFLITQEKKLRKLEDKINKK